MSTSSRAVFKIALSERTSVTAKAEMPSRIGPETPVLILAHGANNDLDHPLLVSIARHLATEAGVMAVRFNFPYVERGSSSPDATSVLEDSYRRVHDHVTDQLAAPEAPVFVGGKSLGGRVAAELLSRGEEGEGIVAAGLVELGYPLHRPGHKTNLFTQPLRKIGVPSLFFVGEKDPFCDPDLLRPLLQQLLHPGRLVVVPGGDHSLQRPTGKKGSARGVSAAADDEFGPVAAEVARFVGEVGARRSPCP